MLESKTVEPLKRMVNEKVWSKSVGKSPPGAHLGIFFKEVGSRVKKL